MIREYISRVLTIAILVEQGEGFLELGNLLFSERIGHLEGCMEGEEGGA